MGGAAWCVGSEAVPRSVASAGTAQRLVGRKETQDDDCHRRRERRREQEADAHRLGEGVAGRGEQAGGGVGRELGGDRGGRADRVLRAGLGLRWQADRASRPRRSSRGS